MPDWPHVPTHRILESGTYIITAGTFEKEKFFYDSIRLNMLYGLMLETAEWFKISLNAWALMANHYHIIVSVESPETLKKFIVSFHKNSSLRLNKLDRIEGRRVWYNYWDTKITYQKSYYARLNYVNKNPEHHGIVEKAEEYYWCTEAWYKYHSDPAFAKTVDSFSYSIIKIFDDF